MRPLAGTAIVRVSGSQIRPNAQVAELVDALASGASGRKVVGVQVSPWAPDPKGPLNAGLFSSRTCQEFHLFVGNLQQGGDNVGTVWLDVQAVGKPQSLGLSGQFVK